MLIGIPTELLEGENRVAATPETVKKFVAKGLHQVLVQTGAGEKSSFPDSAYEEAGASLVEMLPKSMKALNSSLKFKVRVTVNPLY